jgi:hypothetical protein
MLTCNTKVFKVELIGRVQSGNASTTFHVQESRASEFSFVKAFSILVCCTVNVALTRRPLRSPCSWRGCSKDGRIFGVQVSVLRLIQS